MRDGSLAASMLPSGKICLRGEKQALSWTNQALSLDCYWVGSLDFNFLGNKGVFHSTPKKLNFLQGVNSNQVSEHSAQRHAFFSFSVFLACRGLAEF